MEKQKSRLFFTGDTHGEYTRFALEYYQDLSENDYLVVCGDFGFLFHPKGTAGYDRQQSELDEMEKLPFTVLWVDGNHENFDLIKEYKAEYWNGGRIHRIRQNVLHLMRGQVYSIDGIKLFTMGGAYSIDKYMRGEGISWWKGELPSNDEYREATQNLKEVGNEVDIIVTHTAPREMIGRMGKYPDRHDAELTGFLDWIMCEVKFQKWYFGHWHQDKDITPKARALWFDVVEYQHTES